MDDQEQLQILLDANASLKQEIDINREVLNNYREAIKSLTETNRTSSRVASIITEHICPTSEYARLIMEDQYFEFTNHIRLRGFVQAANMWRRKTGAGLKETWDFVKREN